MENLAPIALRLWKPLKETVKTRKNRAFRQGAKSLRFRAETHGRGLALVRNMIKLALPRMEIHWLTQTPMNGFLFLSRDAFSG